DRRVAVVEGRLPLVRLAANEAVEVVKALEVRPAVERAGDAGFPVGDVVVLAEEGRAVAVLADDLRNHRTTPRNLPGVAGEAATKLGDATGGRGVVVAARKQGRPRRRAKRGRVEAGVPEAVFGQLVQVGCRDLPPEGAPLAET